MAREVEFEDDGAPAEEVEKEEPVMIRVPKLVGYDAECGNFVLEDGKRRVSKAAASSSSAYREEYDDHYGATGYLGGSDNDAASALLGQVEGVSTKLAQRRDARLRRKAVKMAKKKSAYGGDVSYGMWYRDYGRKWLTNGGCAYIDCQKLELCTPIVRSAKDHVKYAHAMFRIARGALEMARADGKDVHVLLNNSDGHGNSWGTHVNMLVTRRCWENIFHRKLQYLLYLASYQVSSIVFTGQGKVGAEDGNPWVNYQLSQRADFFKVMVGEQTTFNRPIVNSRDEALCGGADKLLARLHCIFYDQNLCHMASFLKIGVLQIILAMIETESMDPNLLLDDPLDAIGVISRDPALKAKVRMAGGKDLTAVEVQFGFLEAAKRFAEDGGLDGAVPMHAEILSAWEETLVMLRDGDFEALAPRLDWVLKKLAIERAMEQGGFGWRSAEAKKLDHKYADLAEGLYFAYEEAGVTEQIVPSEEINLAMEDAPVDTRSWFVGEMLRRSSEGEVEVDDVDWDEIEFKFPREKGMDFNGEIKLGDPQGHTMAMCQPILDGAGTMEEKLEKLGLREKTWPYYYGGKGSSYGKGSHYDFRRGTTGHDAGSEEWSEESYERERGFGKSASNPGGPPGGLH
jgi:proteasome accessory factor A